MTRNRSDGTSVTLSVFPKGQTRPSSASSSESVTSPRLGSVSESLDEKPLPAIPSITSQSNDDHIIIGWATRDPENPHNWSTLKKSYAFLMTCMLVINSTMDSALPCMAVAQLAGDFGPQVQDQRVLPISVFLIGYVFGPVIWAPLSEQFGRKRLTVVTFAAFTIFTMACALAPTWASFLGFRLCTGVFASAPVAVSAGILADCYGDARTRGKAFSAFLVTTVFGPIFGPIVSGFASPHIGWRWAFWIALMYAAVTFVMLLFLPETHHPTLLSQRASRLRRAGHASVRSPRDLEATDAAQLISKVLMRPLRMLFTEPIVAATCAYLALAYAIFYMSFQVFPIIFLNFYHLSPGMTGLAFLPIGMGAILSMMCFWCWDSYVARSNANWTKSDEYRRVPLATIGGPLFVISLFWLGFTTREGFSFVVPMLAGLPFGMGFQLIFMTLLNYLTDAYEIYAASANAAASASRSMLAVVLPLAASAMINNLGIFKTCAILGSLSAAMSIIPFIFLWKGEAMRQKSPFCIALRKRKEELQQAEQQRLEKEGGNETSASV